MMSSCVVIQLLLFILIISESVKCATIVKLDDLNDLNTESNIIQATNVCLTQSCNDTSAFILNMIDDTVNPCDDFYKFSCGKFVKNAVIPDSRKEVSSFSTLQTTIYDQLFLDLNENIQSNDSHTINVAKVYFASCMDQESSEARGIQPLVEMLERYGGWPVVNGDNWNETNWNWIETIGKMSNDGFHTEAIISPTTIRDLKNSSRYVFMMERPEFGIKKELIVNFRKLYYNYMVDTAVYFGANKTIAELQMAEALSFEILLANLTYPSVNVNISDMYSVYTVRELSTKYPSIDWLKYVRAILPNDVKIDENDFVALGLLEYFERLGDLLQKTSKRTIANYLIWRCVLFSSKFLNKKMLERHLNFAVALHGTQKQNSLHIQCVAYTNEHLPISVGAIYMKNHFNEQSKRAAADIVTNLQTEFINVLHSVQWMDNETKAEALEKAKLMHKFIASVDEDNETHELEYYFNELHLELNNFFKNFLRIMRFNEVIKHRKLHEIPSNEGHWIIRAKTSFVNAFYSLSDNSIFLPAAVLQLPFYSADRPAYINYGSVGQFVGHEITHAFDLEGRLFNRNGILMDWWVNAENEFIEKATCFFQQYSNYQVDDNQSLNGGTTLSENIADNGGLKAAYKAYQHFVSFNGPEPLLPGLNYTQQQLFWISSAQNWCSVIRPKYLKTLVETDIHAPNQWRVIGMISNQPDFARDFQCPIGSSMNPNDKCEIW